MFFCKYYTDLFNIRILFGRGLEEVDVHKNNLNILLIKFVESSLRYVSKQIYGLWRGTEQKINKQKVQDKHTHRQG